MKKRIEGNRRTVFAGRRFGTGATAPRRMQSYGAVECIRTQQDREVVIFVVGGLPDEIFDRLARFG